MHTLTNLPVNFYIGDQLVSRGSFLEAVNVRTHEFALPLPGQHEFQIAGQFNINFFFRIV